MSGKDFDEGHFRTITDKFQEKWVTSTEEIIKGTSEQDILTHCRQLREKYRQSLDNMP